MPLANSLQSLSPARADLPGVGQPHGPAPAALCGPRRGEGRGQAAVASEPSPVTRRPARRPRDGGGRWPPDGTLPYARRRPASAPGLGPPPRPPLSTNSLSSLEKEEGDEQVLCLLSPKFYILGKQLKERDKRGAPGRTPFPTPASPEAAEKGATRSVWDSSPNRQRPGGAPTRDTVLPG